MSVIFCNIAYNLKYKTMKPTEFYRLKNGSKDFEIRKACNVINPEPFGFTYDDLIEFAESYLKHKIESISNEYIDKIPFSEHNYQECDEEYFAWKRGIKWLKQKLIEI